MGYEAELAKKVSYQFECKKDGFSQLQSGNSKVTLTINPNDLPMELVRDTMGQRYMCVLVPIGDDEAPRIQETKPKSFAGQAKMMAQDKQFHKFIRPHAEIGNLEAEYEIEDRCGIKSCADIIEGTEPGLAFKRLQAEFLNWKDLNERFGGQQ